MMRLIAVPPLMLLVVNVGIHVCSFLPGVPQTLFTFEILLPLIALTVVAFFVMGGMAFSDFRRHAAAWNRKSHAEKRAEQDAIECGEAQIGEWPGNVPRSMWIVFGVLCAYTSVTFPLGLFFVEAKAVEENVGFARHFWPLVIMISLMVFLFIRYRHAPPLTIRRPCREPPSQSQEAIEKRISRGLTVGAAFTLLSSISLMIGVFSFISAGGAWNEKERLVVGLLTAGTYVVVGTTFSVVGMVFLIGGLAYCVRQGDSWRQRHQRRKVLKHGVAITATVADIRMDESIRFEHRSPWILIAEVADKIVGDGGRFESHGIWVAVDEAYPVGSEVTVYYLPDKPSLYAFDLDRLPDDGAGN